MLISHKHKFIFIKTQKTAGTAIEIALRNFMDNGDIVTPLHRKDEIYCKRLGLIGATNYRAAFNTYNFEDAWSAIKKRRLKRRFYGLMPAKEIHTQLSSETWNNYLKISIERNPFDKAISSYYWHNRKSSNPPSLCEWLRDCSISKISNWKSYTINDTIAVNLVIKYENLTNELLSLSERLGLETAIKLPPQKPKGNIRKDRRPWQEVIDATSKERIRQVCRKELEAFYSQITP